MSTGPATRCACANYPNQASIQHRKSCHPVVPSRECWVPNRLPEGVISSVHTGGSCWRALLRFILTESVLTVNHVAGAVENFPPTVRLLACRECAAPLHQEALSSRGRPVGGCCTPVSSCTQTWQSEAVRHARVELDRIRGSTRDNPKTYTRKYLYLQDCVVSLRFT